MFKKSSGGSFRGADRMAKILRHLGIGNTRKPPTPPLPDYNNGGQRHVRLNSDGSPCQDIGSPERSLFLPELQEYVDPADCQIMCRAHVQPDDEDELYSEPVKQQDDDEVYTEPYQPPMKASSANEELYSDASANCSHPEANSSPVVQYDLPGERVNAGKQRNKTRTPIAVVEPYRDDEDEAVSSLLVPSPSLQSVESSDSDEMAIRQRHMYETAFDSKVRHKIDDKIDKLMQSPVLHECISRQPRVKAAEVRPPSHPKVQQISEKRKVTLSDVPGRAKSSNPSCSEVGPEVQLQSGNPQPKPASSPKGQLDREVVSELSKRLKNRGKDQKSRRTSSDDPPVEPKSHAQGPEFDTRPNDEYDLPWDLPKPPVVPKRASSGVELPPQLPPVDTRPIAKPSHLPPMQHDHVKVIKRVHGAEAKMPCEASHVKGSTSGDGPEDRARDASKNPQPKGVEARRSLNLDFDVAAASSSAKGMRQNLALNFGCSALNVAGEKVNPVAPLEEQQWYHGAISRHDAENLLRVLKEGSYLVRNSESSKDDFSLSLKSARGFMHMKIVFTNGKYILGQFSKPFASIPEMISHYSNNKLPIRGAEHMSLLYPVFYQVL